MNLADKLIKLLKEKHGQELNLQEEIYYLFLKDGLFTLWLDQDTKTLKVEVEFQDEDARFVYMSDEKLEDLLEGDIDA